MKNELNLFKLFLYSLAGAVAGSVVGVYIVPRIADWILYK